MALTILYVLAYAPTWALVIRKVIPAQSWANFYRPLPSPISTACLHFWGYIDPRAAGVPLPSRPLADPEPIDPSTVAHLTVPENFHGKINITTDPANGVAANAKWPEFKVPTNGNLAVKVFKPFEHPHEVRVSSSNGTSILRGSLFPHAREDGTRVYVVEDGVTSCGLFIGTAEELENAMSSDISPPKPAD